jgi:hypothetical protein
MAREKEDEAIRENEARSSDANVANPESVMCSGWFCEATQ